MLTQVVDNLSLLVDESGDVVEVSLLHCEEVCSEAKLHLQGKHPPPEPPNITSPIFEKWVKTFTWSNIFGKLSKCEKPPAHPCSPLFLCLRLFHFITTNGDALPKYNIYFIHLNFFIYSSCDIFWLFNIWCVYIWICSDLQPTNILHKLILQLLLKNLHMSLFVEITGGSSNDFEKYFLSEPLSPNSMLLHSTHWF